MKIKNVSEIERCEICHKKEGIDIEKGICERCNVYYPSVVEPLEKENVLIGYVNHKYFIVNVFRDVVATVSSLYLGNKLGVMIMDAPLLVVIVLLFHLPITILLCCLIASKKGSFVISLIPFTTCFVTLRFLTYLENPEVVEHWLSFSHILTNLLFFLFIAVSSLAINCMLNEFRTYNNFFKFLDPKN